eukprot:ANDGO_06196.mRNA.1 hypothetical protein
MDILSCVSRQIHDFVLDPAKKTLQLGPFTDRQSRLFVYALADRIDAEVSTVDLPSANASSSSLTTPMSAVAAEPAVQITLAKGLHFRRVGSLAEVVTRTISADWEKYRTAGFSLRCPPSFVALVATRFELDWEHFRQRIPAEVLPSAKLEQTRVARDGPFLQMCVFSKEELANMWDYRKSICLDVFGLSGLETELTTSKVIFSWHLLQFLERQIDEGIRSLQCLGVGSACSSAVHQSNVQCVALFLVYKWDWLTEIREPFGRICGWNHMFCPHVSIAFGPEDVHGVARDSSSLLNLSDPNAENIEQ